MWMWILRIIVGIMIVFVYSDVIITIIQAIKGNRKERK